MRNDEMEDALLISGLQHFAFCRRQWALIHIEQAWAENAHTVQGDLFHRNSHDQQRTERRGECIITRGMAVFSRALGITGQCDVVEFHADPQGVSLNGWDGKWKPFPVEYKKGRPKAHDADELQLCAQAMCLEGMLACSIESGALFYGEPHRRTPVDFDAALRGRVAGMLAEMRGLFQRGHTPRVKPSKACRQCSLASICAPGLVTQTASGYVSDRLGEVEPCAEC